MRHSDIVLAIVLESSGRGKAMTTERLTRAGTELAEVLSNLDAICDADDDEVVS